MSNPFFFGTSDRQLFGAYHPARGGGHLGAVLCHPWGPEYPRAHRAMRFLAELLANSGRHVLRFDWYGTGDSGGECFEGGEPRSWAQDLQEAVEELKDMADLRNTAIVGLRMGAIVGAQIAKKRIDVDRLVLWDPIVEGTEYLDSLVTENDTSFSHAYPDHLSDGGAEICEVNGFPLTPTMREGIATLVPSIFGSGLPPTLLVTSVPDLDRYSRVREELDLGGVEWCEENFDDPEAWIEEGDLGRSGMPAALVRRITEWLS